MKVFIATLPFGSYTLTTVSETEKGARAALRKEYNRAIKNVRGEQPRTFEQHAEWSGLNVWPTELEKVEWM